MYILDEIDAALDLQHTQHIGQLFRNRFKGSQFIVVSLKEGLFTNANVLFRARFRDGTSIVEVSLDGLPQYRCCSRLTAPQRTAHRTSNPMYSEDKENSSDASHAGHGKGRNTGAAAAGRAPLVVR